jgi:hypothetical protein
MFRHFKGHHQAKSLDIKQEKNKNSLFHVINALCKKPLRIFITLYNKNLSLLKTLGRSQHVAFSDMHLAVLTVY